MAAMKSMRVHLTAVVSTSVEVEVDLSGLSDPTNMTEVREAAVELAYERNLVSLCHQCSVHMDGPEDWHPGTWSPDPESLEEMVEEL